MSDDIRSAEMLSLAIQDMRDSAFHAFDDIAAVARLALLALEAPQDKQRPRDIAQALRLICHRAEQGGDDINSLAKG